MSTPKITVQDFTNSPKVQNHLKKLRRLSALTGSPLWYLMCWTLMAINM